MHHYVNSLRLPLLLVVFSAYSGNVLVTQAFFQLCPTTRIIRRPTPVVQLPGTAKNQKTFQQYTSHQWPPLRLNLFGDSNNEGANGSITSDQERPVLISSKSAITQQLFVVASVAALAIGTYACITLWYGTGQALLGTEYFRYICQQIFPISFGVIFSAVGVGHFVFVDNFARIVPPKGTWGGLWQLPAPFSEQLGIPYGDYQSYVSGVLELIGGLWLLAGGFGFTDPTLPGMFLLLLTIAVSPANLYMYTHDVGPGGIVPPLSYPWGHLARFVLQCGLLSNFWIVAHPPAL